MWLANSKALPIERLAGLGSGPGCIRRGRSPRHAVPPFPSRAELTAPAVDGNLESRQRQGRDNQGSNAVILIPQIFSSPQVVNPGAFSGLTLLRPAWLDIAPPPNLAPFPIVAELLRELGPTLRRRCLPRQRDLRQHPTGRASDGPIAARPVCPAARPRPSPSPHRHAQQPSPARRSGLWRAEHPHPRRRRTR